MGCSSTCLLVLGFSITCSVFCPSVGVCSRGSLGGWSVVTGGISVCLFGFWGASASSAFVGGAVGSSWSFLHGLRYLMSSLIVSSGFMVSADVNFLRNFLFHTVTLLDPSTHIKY